MIRRACLALGLFAAGLIAVSSLELPPGRAADDKKDKKDKKDKDTKEEIALRAQLKDARQDLNRAEAQIAALQADAKAGAARIALLQAELKREKKEDVGDAKTIAGLTAQLNGVRAARYVHIGTWKRKADAAESEVQLFLDDVPAILGKCKWVRGAWAGKSPAVTAEYEVSVVLLFDDADGFAKFQADPQYKRFHERHDKKWDAAKAFDGVVPQK